MITDLTAQSPKLTYVVTEQIQANLIIMLSLGSIESDNVITPCIPLMQLNMLRHRLMQHFTRVGKNGER